MRSVGIDFNATATSKAQRHGQPVRRTTVHKINEDSLRNLLAELWVITVGHEVFQQPLMTDAVTRILDKHAGVIRLTGHGTH